MRIYKFYIIISKKYVITKEFFRCVECDKSNFRYNLTPNNKKIYKKNYIFKK